MYGLVRPNPPKSAVVLLQNACRVSQLMFTKVQELGVEVFGIVQVVYIDSEGLIPYAIMTRNVSKGWRLELLL